MSSNVTFQGLADIENNVAREMTKLGAVIQVPFRSGNQFLGEGGLQVRWLHDSQSPSVHPLQDVYYQIRDRTRAIADQHANLGRTIDGSIVQHLQKLRVEIKAHIKVSRNCPYIDISLIAPRTSKMTPENLQRRSPKNVNIPPNLSATLAQTSPFSRTRP